MFSRLLFCVIVKSFMIFGFIGVTFSFISTSLWSNKRGFNSPTLKDLIMSCLSRSLAMKLPISYHLFTFRFNQVPFSPGKRKSSPNLAHFQVSIHVVFHPESIHFITKCKNFIHFLQSHFCSAALHSSIFLSHHSFSHCFLDSLNLFLNFRLLLIYLSF